jgi:hypothetical protein
MHASRSRTRKPVARAGESTEIAHPEVTNGPRRALPWALAATLAFVLVTTIVAGRPWRAAPVPLSQHLSVDLGADVFLAKSVLATTQFAISRDGSMLAFVGERNGVERLYLRRFGQLQAVPLVSGSASERFFSPDSQGSASSALPMGS